jgi:hypothetical protein
LKTEEHRADIAVALKTRGGRMDLAARRRLLNRLARTD